MAVGEGGVRDSCSLICGVNFSHRKPVHRWLDGVRDDCSLIIAAQILSAETCSLVGCGFAIASIKHQTAERESLASPTPSDKRGKLCVPSPFQQPLQNRVSRVRIFLPLPRKFPISTEIGNFLYLSGQYTIRRDHRRASNCPSCAACFELFRLVQHQKSIMGWWDFRRCRGVFTCVG